MDVSRLHFCVKVRTSMEKRRSDDAEEAGMQCIRVVLHRERALGDEKLLSPGFPGVKQRAPGYSLLASSRLLGPRLPASTKALLSPVTRIDKESL